MADPVLLDDCDIWLGGYEVGPAFNRIAVEATRAEQAAGRFGDTVEAFYPGLKQVSVVGGGLFSTADSSQPGTILFDRVNTTGTAWPLTILPPVDNADPNTADARGAYSIVSHQFGFQFGASHGELIPFTFGCKANSGNDLYGQLHLSLAKSLRTGSANGDSYNFGDLSTTNKLVSIVHLFAITGGSLVITIESDTLAAFGSATTQDTHSALTTAPNYSVRELTGSTSGENFWRAVATYTPGTDFTVAVLIGMQDR